MRQDWNCWIHEIYDLAIIWAVTNLIIVLTGPVINPCISPQAQISGNTRNIFIITPGYPYSYPRDLDSLSLRMLLGRNKVYILSQFNELTKSINQMNNVHHKPFPQNVLKNKIENGNLSKNKKATLRGGT